MFAIWGDILRFSAYGQSAKDPTLADRIARHLPDWPSMCELALEERPKEPRHADMRWRKLEVNGMRPILLYQAGVLSEEVVKFKRVPRAS